MASSVETWIVIGRDGQQLADILGNVATFTTRQEAEGWLLPGERLEVRRAEVTGEAEPPRP